MKQGIFSLKLKMDHIPIIDENFNTFDAMDTRIDQLRKKFEGDK